MRPRQTLTVLLGFALVAAASVAVTATVTVAPTASGATTDPLQAAFAASAAPGYHWTPDPATYGVAQQSDVPVRMSDGTVLRAVVATPTDTATGKPAAGPFPVLLTMTPYGKNVTSYAGLGVNNYFVQRGYIDVAVDVRGTGDSAGSFDLFSPQQVSDGVALVHWAAALPHSDGKVGTYGPSYLGIDQMLTAGAVGPDSPLKAIFPAVSANDLYRDTAFMGGIPDAEFDAIYLGALLPVVNLVNPIVGALVDPTNILGAAQVELQHAKNTLDYNALFLLTTYLGGPDSFDTSYWQQRSPGNVLSKIVANGIPAYLIGGEYDLFQRGEPLNYAGLQNAWAGRPVDAPMVSGQPVTGRYQLLDGPFTHLQGSGVGVDYTPLQLEWFDTWLKNENTGMAQTPTPLHYYDLGSATYAETTTYPITGATPTTYYLSAGHVLSPSAPRALLGADPLVWSPVGSSLCDRSADQWSAGIPSLATSPLPPRVPCFDDDRASQVGPTESTYSTGALSAPRTIAGPIAATLYATATTTETEWTVEVEDVSPDGTSTPLTEGALLGSQRADDAARSWVVDGKTVIPYHDYTASSARPVVPGALTRYDIEIFPTYATIAAGHRIRVTISTTDFPHLIPTPPQLARLVGGIYALQRTSLAPSSITLPLSGQ